MRGNKPAFTAFFSTLLLLAIFLSAPASATPCLLDSDCNATSFCNDSLECQSKLADGQPCTRDPMCTNYCVVDTCGNPVIDLAGFNVPPTTNLSAEADLTNVTMVLDHTDGQVNWTLNLDLSDGANFTSGCQFAAEWVSCNPLVLPGLAGKEARVWLKNTPWPLRNLSGIAFVRDGWACGGFCYDQEKSLANILWNVSSFSNYSVQSTGNYSAAIANFSVPDVCYLDGNCTVYFILGNTLGERLEGQDADIYVTDGNGTMVIRFPTLQYYSNNTFQDENNNWVSDVPVTNKLGEYLYEFPLDRDLFRSGGNYTVHAVANNIHASESVYLDIPARRSAWAYFWFIRRYSGVIVFYSIGAVLVLFIVSVAAAVIYWSLRRTRGRNRRFTLLH